jgi:hypothetical protein
MELDIYRGQDGKVAVVTVEPEATIAEALALAGLAPGTDYYLADSSRCVVGSAWSPRYDAELGYTADAGEAIGFPFLLVVDPVRPDDRHGCECFHMWGHPTDGPLLEVCDCGGDVCPFCLDHCHEPGCAAVLGERCCHDASWGDMPYRPYCFEHMPDAGDEEEADAS